MNPDIWGVFHDGVVSGIDGRVPGDLVLAVKIGYLRAMFEGKGSGFRILLEGCSHFRFNEYDEAPTDDLARILSREPKIIYVNQVQPLVLDCVMGTLELAYRTMSITLDTGETVSAEVLASECERYWSEWSDRNQRRG